MEWENEVAEARAAAEVVYVSFFFRQQWCLVLFLAPGNYYVSKHRRGPEAAGATLARLFMARLTGIAFNNLFERPPKTTKSHTTNLVLALHLGSFRSFFVHRFPRFPTLPNNTVSHAHGGKSLSLSANLPAFVGDWAVIRAHRHIHSYCILGGKTPEKEEVGGKRESSALQVYNPFPGYGVVQEQKS